MSAFIYNSHLYPVSTSDLQSKDSIHMSNLDSPSSPIVNNIWWSVAPQLLTTIYNNAYYLPWHTVYSTNTNHPQPLSFEYITSFALYKVDDSPNITLTIRYFNGKLSYSNTDKKKSTSNEFFIIKFAPDSGSSTGFSIIKYGMSASAKTTSIHYIDTNKNIGKVNSLNTVNEIRRCIACLEPLIIKLISQNFPPISHNIMCAIVPDQNKLNTPCWRCVSIYNIPDYPDNINTRESAPRFIM